MTSEVVAHDHLAPHDERMLASVLLLVVAAINVAPVVVTFAPARAVALYGLDPKVLADPVTLVLLRHRGVLFGLVSIWLGASALVPELRPWAIGTALLAKLAFLALYAAEPWARAPLRRVASADVIAIVMLALAAIAL